MKNYKILSSTSEYKIKVWGENLGSLFNNSLLGMFNFINPVIKNNQEIRRDFAITAFDCELLLVNFLSEALYLSSVNKEYYFKANFNNISNTQASGFFVGYEIIKFNHGEIKAVTHHDLQIKNINNRLETQILFDI